MLRFELQTEIELEIWFVINWSWHCAGLSAWGCLDQKLRRIVLR